MNKEQTIIYIDISDFLETRKTTGIQRVIRELIPRIIDDTYVVNIIYYDELSKSFKKVQNNEITPFFQDVKNYSFKHSTDSDIFNAEIKNKIFFDIDSAWNANISRMYLYPKLKEHGFQIFNFIYDLIPVLFPNYLYEKSKQNFPNFIKSVCLYSDLVFFDSYSAQKDFLKYKNELRILREIYVDVIPLGSDYTIYSANSEKYNHQYEQLLSKKYILFVGTIEPRKQQMEVLKSFEKLHVKYRDLNLVYIGKVGWNVDEFINEIFNHPLKNINIFHLTDVEDNTLSLFYQNAFIVTYLSNYEGYGLPIAESLSYGNVTISSKNSSLYEVGLDYADYVEHSIQRSFIELVSYYIDNPNAFNLRKKYIKQNYKRTTWNDFYTNLINIFEKFAILTPFVTIGDKRDNDTNKQ